MAASQRRSADARSAALDAGLKTAPGLTLGIDAGKKALELAEGSDLGGKASKFGGGLMSRAKDAASGAVDATKRECLRQPRTQLGSTTADVS